MAEGIGSYGLVKELDRTLAYQESGGSKAPRIRGPSPFRHPFRHPVHGVAGAREADPAYAVLEGELVGRAGGLHAPLVRGLLAVEPAFVERAEDLDVLAVRHDAVPEDVAVVEMYSLAKDGPSVAVIVIICTYPLFRPLSRPC